MTQPTDNISQITPGAARKIADTVRGFAGKPLNSADKANRFNTVPPLLMWGTLTAVWTPGTNVVTLQPCKSGLDNTSTGADTVECFVSIPLGRYAQCLGANVGDILAYVPVGFAFDGETQSELGGSSDPYVLWQPPLIPWFGSTDATQYQIISNASAIGGSPNLTNNWLQAADVPST